MSKKNYSEIKHDFKNSVTLIKSLSRSADRFVEKFCETLNDNPSLSKKHIELFKQSMKSVEAEAGKLENLFLKALEKESKE